MWAGVGKQKVLKSRRDLADLKASVERILHPVYEAHAVQLERLVRLLNAKQTNQSGEPSTEAQEAYTSKNVLSRASPHERYLLKKAFRYAARLAHPDHGGSMEAFHAVRMAYLDGDLRSLQEFALAMHKTPVEQYAFWVEEQVRVRIDAELFRNSPEFAIAKLVQQNKKPKAIEAMGTLLTLREAAALTQP